MLPRLIVGELIGLPEEDHVIFKNFFMDRLAKMAEAAANPEAAFSQRNNGDDGITENQFLTEYFIKAISDRRERPIGDIMSDLGNATFPDGEPVPLEHIVSMITLLYAAGGDANTPELMTNSMLVLLRHPEMMDEFRANPDLVDNFIEEVLRFDTPVPGVFRVATRDTSVGGVPVAKGDKLMIIYGSGNHDDARFPDPETFDRERNFEYQHLGFGHGVHFCPGASLARLEGKVAVQEILRRLDNIRMAPGSTIPYVPSVIQRIPIRLQLQFDRRA
jgi:cytochrome P450